MERNSSAQIGVLHKQIEDVRTNISQNSDKTDIVYTNLKLDLFNLSTSVQQQLDTISKMPGPRVSSYDNISETNFVVVFLFYQLD